MTNMAISPPGSHLTIRSDALATDAFHKLICEHSYYTAISALTLQGPRFCAKDAQPACLNSIPSVLEARPLILELTVHSIPLSLEQMHLIAQAIRTHRALQKIHFTNNTLGDQGLHHIFQALKYHPSLERVVITNNSDEACKAETEQSMAQALITIPQLRVLNLQGNNITEDGALAIAKAYEERPDVQLFLGARLLLLPSVKSALLKALTYNFTMIQTGLPKIDEDVDYKNIFSRNVIVQSHRACTLFDLIFKQWMTSE